MFAQEIIHSWIHYNYVITLNNDPHREKNTLKAIIQKYKCENKIFIEKYERVRN